MRRRLLVPIATLGLLLAAAAATVPGAMAGGGCHADMTGAVHGDGPATVVRMDVCSFEPTVARVAVGTEVTFLNTAPLDHVVLGRGQSWGAVGNLRPGAQLVERFEEPGIFPYSCPLHPGMVGAIVVGDGAAAAAAADGGGVPQAQEAEPAAPAEPHAAAASAAGVDPATAIGLGGLTGIVVLGLGALLVRRRAGTEPLAG